MVQHMLLKLVAAPLLLAGAPITLALRASSPAGAAGAAGGAPQPGRQGALLPGRRVAPVRRGELGLAFQRALQRGAGEPAAAPLPARDLPRRRASLLVAGHRRRSLAVAHAAPGAPLLPLPGDAAELVPRRRAAERRRRSSTRTTSRTTAPGDCRRSRTSSSAACSCGSSATSRSWSGWWSSCWVGAPRGPEDGAAGRAAGGRARGPRRRAWTPSKQTGRAEDRGQTGR